MIIVEQYDFSALKLTSEITILSGGESIKAVGVWDTGADRSQISKELVPLLRTEPIGQELSRGINGEKISDLYKVAIKFPGGVFTDILVAEAILIDHRFNFIIGMDIIRFGSLSISNDGIKQILQFIVDEKS